MMAFGSGFSVRMLMSTWAVKADDVMGNCPLSRDTFTDQYMVAAKGLTRPDGAIPFRPPVFIDPEHLALQPEQIEKECDQLNCPRRRQICCRQITCDIPLSSRGNPYYRSKLTCKTRCDALSFKMRSRYECKSPYITNHLHKYFCLTYRLPFRVLIINLLFKFKSLSAQQFSFFSSVNS